MKSKCIAIIPARGGSKRVTRKNITDLAGKPILSYTIEAAQAAGVFDHIFVNSEDDEILEVAQSLGADIYRRPEELSCDNSSVITVVQEMLEGLSISDDTVVFILLPTSPLREKDDLIAVYELFNNSKKESAVVTVTSFDPPIQLAQFINIDGKLEPVFKDDYNRSTKSVGHRESYRFNECAVVNLSSGFKTHKNLIGDDSIPYVMSAEKSMVIDYWYQKEIIELILKERRTPSNGN